MLGLPRAPGLLVDGSPISKQCHKTALLPQKGYSGCWLDCAIPLGSCPPSSKMLVLESGLVLMKIKIALSAVMSHGISCQLAVFLDTTGKRLTDSRSRPDCTDGHLGVQHRGWLASA